MSKPSIEILNNYQYKKLFLPHLNDTYLKNESKIQVYRLEDYLRGILMPVIPYRTTFNFLILLTQGDMTQYLDSGAYTLVKNEIINVKNGNITATLSISDDIQGYFVVYENEVITDISLGANDLKFFTMNPYVKLNDINANWVSRTLDLLEEESLSEQRDIEICITLLETVLMKVIRVDMEKKTPMSRQLDIAFRFRELVQKFHIDHKNVLFYANLLHISENYLNKCVKEATNKPPKQWINEISILHSQILLQDKTRDIAGIAFELKYNSPSYFTRLFKKTTGYSPSDYRRHKFLL
ncbi:AraC family transcriptional regulator [Myroides sp. 1354]|uniref:helix-turn-helix domain-containing protein n=1 Tax=unclassified Myroides TaxID=2642485 RepID=UPI002576E692|nr:MULTISPECIES: helix-turn-helix domain-containing protein [unclassified Myroides]MDM1044673.1 AraC family transcriptional regulator [Myroides sp. R163-1]MDM1055386.1 AraC family transcriptional regulator [Myroides sp. 1354]MDM1068683.1 AraC family transcriptional regulator [Myroides sp. 1372]